MRVYCSNITFLPFPKTFFANSKNRFTFISTKTIPHTLNTKSMSSTSETGHAVNYNNFNILIARCTGYSTRYNPSNTLIKLASLQSVYSSAGNALQHIVQFKPAWDNAINSRQQLFADMVKLATRIINAFDASEDVTDEQVNDAKTIIRKIRGERKSKKNLNPGPDDPVQISVSQQSYANQVFHFGELVGIVTAVPTYTPNETELQSANLVLFLDSLNTANQTVATTQQPYLDAVTERNTVFYAKKTGLVDLALEVKKYVKSVQTITPTEFKQISGLKFSRPRKK